MVIALHWRLPRLLLKKRLCAPAVWNWTVRGILFTIFSPRFGWLLKYVWSHDRNEPIYSTPVFALVIGLMAFSLSVLRSGLFMKLYNEEAGKRFANRILLHAENSIAIRFLISAGRWSNSIRVYSLHKTLIGQFSFPFCFEHQSSAVIPTTHSAIVRECKESEWERQIHKKIRKPGNRTGN